MMDASTSRRAAGLLALAAAGGWVGERTFLHHHHGHAALPHAPPAISSQAALDSATLSLRGQLTLRAWEELTREVGGNSAVLVLLDSADIRVCEDLGRQLRELRRRTAGRAPLVIVTPPGALARVQAFAQRERLRPAAFLSLTPAQLVDGPHAPPTPAVMVARGRTVAGVAHTRRFRNFRGRSFADELSASLPAPAGLPPPPAARRSP